MVILLLTSCFSIRAYFITAAASPAPVEPFVVPEPHSPVVNAAPATANAAAAEQEQPPSEPTQPVSDSKPEESEYSQSKSCSDLQISTALLHGLLRPVKEGGVRQQSGCGVIVKSFHCIHRTTKTYPKYF